jgi:hypothetical protein
MSFLDTLLSGALGQLRVQSVGGGQSIIAIQGSIVLADPTASSPTVTAPPTPGTGAWFGVADATGQSGTHAINVISSGLSFQLENPASANAYANSVTIAATSRVRFWLYTGSAWKLVYGNF